MQALLVLILLAAPLYVWRFPLLGVPTNFLMLLAALVILAGLILIIARGWLSEFIESVKNTPRWLLVGISLFALASVISLLSFGIDAGKVGQWVVLYAEPMALFLLVRFFVEKYPSLRRHYTTAIYVILAVAGALAILQYATLWTLPADWMGNANEPKRAISFFSHPNFYSLFVTPLLAWLLPDVYAQLKAWWRSRQFSTIWFPLLWLVGALGMFLSLSRGAWLGFAAACAVFAILSANKKIIYTLLTAFVVIAGIIAVTPNLRYRVLLPFEGEKSSVARFSLWHTGEKMIQDTPILGKGVNGFNYNWDKYNTDPGLDHYNFPHNIFLNFWVDSGLLGLLSMIMILLYAVWQGIRKRDGSFQLGLLLFVVAMVVHGLIDIPYFKNDLALVFWTIFALSI